MSPLLDQIGAGEAMLVLAYRPFPSLQPYAETGPVFLHAEACDRYPLTDILPPMLDSPDYIVRGYGDDDRIVYGTGAVTATGEIARGRGHFWGAKTSPMSTSVPHETTVTNAVSPKHNHSIV